MVEATFEMAYPMAVRAAKVRAKAAVLSGAILVADREDLEQEGLTACWRALPQFDPAPAWRGRDDLTRADFACFETLRTPHGKGHPVLQARQQDVHLLRQEGLLPDARAPGADRGEAPHSLRGRGGRRRGQ